MTEAAQTKNRGRIAATPAVAQDPASPRTRSKWSMVMTLLGTSRPRALLLVIGSILTALAEAGILAVVAEAAAALASGNHSTIAHAGPLRFHVSLTELLVAGGVLALARLLLIVPTVALSAWIAADVRTLMLTRLFDSFLRAGWPVKATDREGHLQELMTNQVNQATNAAAQATLLVTNLFAFLALVVSALIISPEAAALVVGVSAVLFAALRPLSRAGSKSARDLSLAHLEQASGIGEAARLAEETQVFGVEGAQRSAVGRLIARSQALYLRTNLTVRLVPGIFQSGVYLLLIGGLGLIYAVDDGGLASLGAIVLLLVRAGTYGNLAQNSYQVIKQALPFVEHVQAAEDRYAQAATIDGTERFESLETLEFRDVSFAYETGPTVLQGLTFDVRGGETIGIIGPSGAGKSTLGQLLLRLRAPGDGDYLVNGVPASAIRADDWTAGVAYVPQNPQLIYATAADNIRYFRDLSDEEVERAARLAHIHEDIAKWPDGYQTMVGPRGAAASMGQAQRLCLARALALRPQILLLDEPTSALDPSSEHLVHESLAALRGALTLFVIAHRMSTLDICDRVMVIVDGRIDTFEAVGSLRARSEYYRAATSELA